MNITMKGVLEMKGETIQVSESFQKRNIVLKVTEENSQYTQMMSLEIIGDYVTRVDNLNLGDTLECHCNLRGRKWESPTGETKYFNSIHCWKIDIVPVNQPQPQPEPQLVATEDVDNDLPF